MPVPLASVEAQSIAERSALALIETAVVKVTNGSGSGAVMSLLLEAKRMLSVKSILCEYEINGFSARPLPGGGLNARDTIEGPSSVANRPTPIAKCAAPPAGQDDGKIWMKA